MTSHLYWQPIPKKKNFISSKLKKLLREYCDQYVLDSVLTDSDIPSLAALVEAGAKDSAELILAIEKHGQILIKEEY